MHTHMQVHYVVSNVYVKCLELNVMHNVISLER
jgi:hypothetical protein